MTRFLLALALVAASIAAPMAPAKADCHWCCEVTVTIHCHN